MIYATKERAIEVAAMLYGPHGNVRAARTAYGWTVRNDNGYSNGDVIEWA